MLSTIKMYFKNLKNKTNFFLQSCFRTLQCRYCVYIYVVVVALESLRRHFETFKDDRYRFQGIVSASLCSLAGRYETLFLLGSYIAPIDCSKVSALVFAEIMG
jgi:hypothetical protein